MKWLRQKWKRWKIGRTWQVRAEELYQIGKSKPSSWDCDIRSKILMDEMQDSGLKFGIHYVTEICRRGSGQTHFRLNVCNLNVDAMTNNRDMGYRVVYTAGYDKDAFWKS